MFAWSQVSFIAAYFHFLGQPMAHFFVLNRAQVPRSAAGRRPVVAMATLKIVAFIAKSNKYFAGVIIS
jgi:hypothetical protein